MKLSIFLQSVTCYYQTVLGETPFPTTTRNISRYLSLLLGLYSSNQGKMSYTLSWDTDVEETKASNVILNTTPFSTSHKFMTRLAFFCNFVSLPVDPDDPFKLTDETRQLGLAVCRGTAVVLICPVDGMEPIANPFLQQEWWQLVLRLLLLCAIIRQLFFSSRLIVL